MNLFYQSENMHKWHKVSFLTTRYKSQQVAFLLKLKLRPSIWLSVDIYFLIEWIFQAFSWISEILTFLQIVWNFTWETSDDLLLEKGSGEAPDFMLP